MDSLNAREKYADIIDLPHHQSVLRPHMPLKDRASQFAPFAALSGFEEMIDEETRYTEHEAELEENMRELIDRQLSLLSQLLDEGKNPEAEFTCFKPDDLKAGGKYVTIRGRIKKIDPLSGMIILFGEDDGPEKLKKTVSVEIGNLLAVELCDANYI